MEQPHALFRRELVASTGSAQQFLELQRMILSSP
jgi:hypothetical protein